MFADVCRSIFGRKQPTTSAPRCPQLTSDVSEESPGHVHQSAITVNALASSLYILLTRYKREDFVDAVEGLAEGLPCIDSLTVHHLDSCRLHPSAWVWSFVGGCCCNPGQLGTLQVPTWFHQTEKCNNYAKFCDLSTPGSRVIREFHDVLRRLKREALSWAASLCRAHLQSFFWSLEQHSYVPMLPIWKAQRCPKEQHLRCDCCCRGLPSLASGLDACGEGFTPALGSFGDRRRASNRGRIGSAVGPLGTFWYILTHFDTSWEPVLLYWTNKVWCCRSAGRCSLPAESAAFAIFAVEGFDGIFCLIFQKIKVVPKTWQANENTPIAIAIFLGWNRDSSETVRQIRPSSRAPWANPKGWGPARRHSGPFDFLNTFGLLWTNRAEGRRG